MWSRFCTDARLILSNNNDWVRVSRITTKKRKSNARYCLLTGNTRMHALSFHFHLLSLLWMEKALLHQSHLLLCLSHWLQSIFTCNRRWKSTHFNRFRPDWSLVSDNQWRISSFTCGFLPQRCDPESWPQFPSSQTHRWHTEECRVLAPESIKTEAYASGKHPAFFAIPHLKLHLNAIYSGSHFKVIQLICIVKAEVETKINVSIFS